MKIMSARGEDEYERPIANEPKGKEKEGEPDPEVPKAGEDRGEKKEEEEKGKQQEESSDDRPMLTSPEYVSIQKRFGSHHDVVQYIDRMKENESVETVVATTTEWEVYRMLKLITGSETTFFSLLANWCTLVQQNEFAAYDKGESFDWLASLREYLDKRALFGQPVSSITDVLLDDAPEEDTSKKRTKFEGIMSPSGTPSGENGGGIKPGRELVTMIQMLSFEYAERRRLFVMIAQRQELLFAALDEMLDEYRYHVDPTQTHVRVPRSTLDNLIQLRDQVEVLIPELFRTV